MAEEEKKNGNGNRPDPGAQVRSREYTESVDPKIVGKQPSAPPKGGDRGQGPKKPSK